MKTRIHPLISLIVVGLLLIPGCIIDDDVFDCERGYGDRVVRDLNIGYFDRVQLNISADIFITQGPELQVTADGQDNIIDLLERDVRNGEWDIEFERCVRNHDKLEIYITMPDIRELTIAGSGDILGENLFVTDDIKLDIPGSGRMYLDLDALHVDGRISGSGKMYLEGTTNDLDFTITGSGDLSAFGLDADLADITINGSGDAEVLVRDFLKIRIPGSGTVYYKGTPALDIEITGSGAVINAN